MLLLKKERKEGKETVERIRISRKIEMVNEKGILDYFDLNSSEYAEKCHRNNDGNEVKLTSVGQNRCQPTE
jgi:hypothetical protein